MKKGLFRLLAATAISAMLLCNTMTALAYTNTVGVVGDGGARIRSAASTDSSVLASVSSGVKVEICGAETAADGYTWYKVYIDGNTIGYIRKDLVTDTGEETGGKPAESVSGQNSGNSAAEVTPEITEGESETTGEETMPEGEQPAASDTSDATLYALSISNGTLTPAFSPEVTEYTITLDADTTAVSAFGVPNAEGAYVTENYGFTDLVAGSNMAVITVTAEDGTTKAYNFLVNRGEASEEIHYQTPPVTDTDTPADTPASDEMQTNGDEATTVPTTESKGGSHTAVIILLVVVVLGMAVLLVLMGLRIRDYRRNLYGEDPEEFHLKDAIPEDSVFSSKRKKNGARRLSSADDDEDDIKTAGDRAYTGGKRVAEPAGMATAGDRAARINRDKELYDSMHADAEDDEAGFEDFYEGSRPESGSKDQFLYQVHSALMEAQGTAKRPEQMESMPSVQPQNPEAAILPEDDELEDITERDATITDNQTGKEVWKSVNFMTPADDLEFEFMDLDDKDE